MLSTLGVGLILLATAPALQPPQPECVVEDTLGRCLVSAVDPGRPGRSTPDRPAGAADVARRGQSAADDDESAAGPPPPPNYLVRPVGEGGWVRNGADVADQVGLPAVVPPPAPAAAGVPVDVLAQRAIEELELAPPAPQLSAGGTGFVGVPVWLWIDGGPAASGPVSATATAGAAQVTATARLSGTEWSMGPPGQLVRCAGPGTPWTGQEGPSPDCGYVYTQRSLPGRTNGAGAWTVTTTAVWTVTWEGTSAGTPVDGTDTVLLSTATALPVGEMQVLVGGGPR